MKKVLIDESFLMELLEQGIIYEAETEKYKRIEGNKNNFVILEEREVKN